MWKQLCYTVCILNRSRIRNHFTGMRLKRYHRHRGTGTDPRYDGCDLNTQSPVPGISFPDDVNYELYHTEKEYHSAYWIVSPEPNFFTDLYVNGEDKPCVEGGDTMYAEMYLVPKGDFYSGENVTVNVTGGEYTGILDK